MTQGDPDPPPPLKRGGGSSFWEPPLRCNQTLQGGRPGHHRHLCCLPRLGCHRPGVHHQRPGEEAGQQGGEGAQGEGCYAGGSLGRNPCHLQCQLARLIWIFKTLLFTHSFIQFAVIHLSINMMRNISNKTMSFWTKMMAWLTINLSINHSFDPKSGSSKS